MGRGNPVRVFGNADHLYWAQIGDVQVAAGLRVDGVGGQGRGGAQGCAHQGEADGGAQQSGVIGHVESVMESGYRVTAEGRQNVMIYYYVPRSPRNLGGSQRVLFFRPAFASIGGGANATSAQAMHFQRLGLRS